MREPLVSGLRPWLTLTDHRLERDLFRRARALTERRFARRMVLFAPLYISNACVNNCLYCGFRRGHRMPRRTLSPDGVALQARALAAAGHRTGLLVAGEDPRVAGPGAVAAAVQAAYSAGLEDVKIEVMPMTVDGYRQVAAAGATGVLVYQETYDRPRYAAAHPDGPKASYAWRRHAPARALTGGIPRIGLGILVGLGDLAADAAGLIVHARQLSQRWGVWPTVSVPRIQPAAGAPWATSPPRRVDDHTFLRLVALLRTALPECGIICSTRESPTMRRRLLELGLGITHLSAGASTVVGGYTDGGGPGQFRLQDGRTPHEVAAELRRLGYVPHWREPAPALVTA